MNPTSQNRFYVSTLDGLRAIAFLLVFVAHALPGFRVPVGFGVTCFFFLSVYLITTLLRIEIAETGTIDLKAFYLRRVLRIFPPMYITYGLACGLTILGVLSPPVGGLTIKAVGAQVAHLTNYFMIYFGEQNIPLGSNVLWSLSVEEHFYALFPIAYLLMYRAGIRRQGCLLGVICLMVLTWRCFLIYVAHASALRVFPATDTRIDSILYGCILAVSFNPALDVESKSHTGVPWVVISALLLGCGLLISPLMTSDLRFHQGLGFTFQGLGLMPIFYVCIRYQRHWTVRWLNWSLLRKVGAWSYTLYLVHGIALSLTAKWLGAGLVYNAGVALLLSVVFSAAMYRIVERPCAGLRRRLSRARAGPDQTPPEYQGQDADYR
jgi:peptidoglycan/LPS O-acetylase OafA/YrhL